MSSTELDPHVAVTVSDSAPPPPSSRPRKAPIIAERYRLDRVIAEGGMGIVFEAWHLVLNEAVAVKIVRREYLHNSDAIQSFIDEARALAELRGPSVAQVLDAGLQDGMPFIVMELLKGRDLRLVAHESGPMSVEKAARLVRQAGLAAAEAHAKGIVHCDLKPENLFLTQEASGEEHIKVIDFGICKRSGTDSDGESMSDKGSPEYMAPEQLDVGRVVDERADVWALGVVLYELVTGSRPFAGEDLDEIKAAVLFEQPIPMHERGVSVPEGFQRLVDKCLQKAPEGRFADASKLCEALSRYEGTIPPSARPSRKAASAIPRQKPAIEAAEPEVERPPTRPAVPWQLSAAALTGTALLALAGWYLSTLHDQRAGSPGNTHSEPSSLRRASGDATNPGEPSRANATVTPAESPPSILAPPSGANREHERARREARRRFKVESRKEGLDDSPGAPSAVRAFPDLAPGDLPTARYAPSDAPSEGAKRPSNSASDRNGSKSGSQTINRTQLPVQDPAARDRL